MGRTPSPPAALAAGHGNSSPEVNIARLTADREVSRRLFRGQIIAVASVTKITAASSEGVDAAVREGLARASRTLRGITGLHVIEHKASVENGKIEEYRVTMEVTFILEN